MAKMMRESSSGSGGDVTTSSTSSDDSDTETSSEEYYDAEEPSTGTLIRFSRKILDGPPKRVDLTTLTPAEIDSCSSAEIFFATPPGENSTGTLNASNMSVASILSKSEMEEMVEEENRRRRLEEMRRRLNTEEIEEVPPDDQTSPSDSQTSSVEGLYGATSGKTSHPFKVVDHDNVSMHSGVSSGRMNRPTSNLQAHSILSPIPSESPSSVSSPVQKLGRSTSPLEQTNSNIFTDDVPLDSNAQLHNSNNNLTRSGNSNCKGIEPDVVVSCKSKDKNSSPMVAPVAPPRKKRLGKTTDSGGESSRDQTPLRENLPEFPSRFESSKVKPNPPSPTVSIRSVCRDLDKTLDTGGQNKIFVVKAQDEEKTRAKNSGPKFLRRTESLPKDVIAAFDPSGSGSGGQGDDRELSGLSNSSLNDTDESVPNVDSYKKRNSLSSITNKNNTLNNKSNSAPKCGSTNLSSIVSAIAAMEERKENESHSLLGDSIRTRTDSGKLLTDLEILEQVQVLNLDTGERMPLSIAEEKIPKCINPLSLHIMRLTSEYVGQRDTNERDSDEESMDSKKSSVASQEDGDTSTVKKGTAKVKRFFGSTVKKTVDKAKSLTQRRHAKEDISTNEDIMLGGGQDPLVKMKASHGHKGPYDFDRLQQVQDLSGEHGGPVWCMKFSNCGRLLATAGQDKIIRIWVLKDHLPYFQDMRTKHTSEKVSPTPSQESIVSQHSQHSAEEMLHACEHSDPRAPFVPRPLCTYSGHTADLLDIAWSKSFFLLSSSMDRTVRLWHISRRECLCCFQHIDFVTAIAFHPRDDRYFLSGSLDGKLRLWNIPDKKVALWNEVNGPNNLITAANFCQNGKFAVVGTYDGRCIFYHTEQLKYHTQIIVHRRKRLTGRKITGIEPMPGEDKILVTSNDSRIRLYDLRDLSLTCKYKGFSNSSSQIKGTVSHDGKYIVCGSENQNVYIWKTHHDYSKFSSARKDRNGYWEGIKAHNAVVTSAVFAPDPDIIVKQIDSKDYDNKNLDAMTRSPSLNKSSYHQMHPSSSPAGYILVSADFSGCIKIFFSKVKPKHSSLPASALA